MSRKNFKPCFSSKDTTVLNRHLHYLVKQKGFKNNLHFINRNLRPTNKNKMNKLTKRILLTTYSNNRQLSIPFCYQPSK